MFALKLLGVPFLSVFNSESDSHVRRFHDALHPSAKRAFDTSIQEMLHSGRRPKDVHLYVAGPPCQSFSTLGKCLGTADSRGEVFHQVLTYIKRDKPIAVVLENVPGLAGQFKEVFGKILQMLLDCGYNVTWDILNTAKHGVPQSRRRVYVVGILKEHCLGPFRFPQSLKVEVPIDAFLDVASRLPGCVSQLPETVTARRNMQMAEKQCKEMGVDPSAQHVVVDIAASKAFSSFQVGKCPCLTASRCRNAGFFLTKLKRPFSLTEIGRLQGFPTCTVKHISTKCPAPADSKRIAHALGNAMSMNVLYRVLHRVVLAAAWQAGEGMGPDVWKQLRRRDGDLQLPDALFPNSEQTLRLDLDDGTPKGAVAKKPRLQGVPSSLPASARPTASSRVPS